ncbi:conserved hypothetical protein [Neospora caninum Liverpool]|uniref:DUF74 family protein, putative n=1 Tax=Neospora caninum (strain Liverpool) TaxID=572307 RepID=F0VAL2_NEOCL|nr:conserved hypothetical protein [Neospora caninum Liverpool]CBZ50701.1 conserved hypothetical protein [Neospora caninum Liverpool]CEL65312.1 TPA: DUF74 family protein, putative [Neospora caninum Liverpool]|eukprot:XP_003880734.1 conserved hypothetical protein [Neospora caninum Liverpool]
MEKLLSSRNSPAVGVFGSSDGHRICVRGKLDSCASALASTSERPSSLKTGPRSDCSSLSSLRDRRTLPRNGTSTHCRPPTIFTESSSPPTQMMGSARQLTSCVHFSIGTRSYHELDSSFYDSFPQAASIWKVRHPECIAPFTPSKEYNCTPESGSRSFSSVPPPHQFFAGPRRCRPYLSQWRLHCSYASFGKQLRGKYPANKQEGRSGSYGATPANPTDVGTGVENGCGDRESSTSDDSNGVLVSTTPSIPGYSITEYKGFVQGCSVRSRDVLRMTKVILMVHLGGEMDDLTTLISRVKREAVNRMCEEAVALGANGVVGVRIVSSGTHQRVAVEFSAYGTAVTVTEDA